MRLCVVCVLAVTLSMLGTVAGAPGVLQMDQTGHSERSGLQQEFSAFTRQLEWPTFKSVYRKSYSSVEEEAYRQAIFNQNLRQIKWHNLMYALGLKRFTQKINEYSDLTDVEFWSSRRCHMATTAPIDVNHTFRRTKTDGQLPSAVDWREHGYVTDIKNQGSCGSCWAFSTTGSLEGQYYRKSGQLVPLSEKNLVDCSSKNDGCNGGWVHKAFEYVKDNGGIDSESSYPYEPSQGSCQYDSSSSVTSLSDYNCISRGSESDLREAVATVGPVSVAIDASHSSFRHYSSGVYDEPACSSYSLDHAVLVVGYSTEDDEDYWLVKNSWGTSWGDEGYIKMSMNKDNQCGIASQALYPIL